MSSLMGCRAVLRNALASISVGLELDIPFERIKRALERLEGVQRRLEIKGDVGGIKILDDYGHHPTEIKITLETIRKSWPGRRVIAVFQPHRYSRTRALFGEFSRSFYQSDVLALLPIYPAGEDRIEGIDSVMLSEAIKNHGHKDVRHFNKVPDAVAYIIGIVKAGDIVLTLGAGDVWKAGETLLGELGESGKTI